jgi:hypothetical protein
MREDDLNFFVTLAGMGNQKLEPCGGEEGHVAAEDEIPFGGAIGGGGMLQRSDDAAEGPFAGPAIFNDFEVVVEVDVFLSVGDNCNFRSAALRHLSNFQQQWSCAKANEGFVAAKARARASGENVPAHI